MKDKCNVCKVMCEISRSYKPRVCAFKHNGDENICPFDARYLDLSKHDKQIRDGIIEERASLLAYICKKYNIPLVDMNQTVDEWQKGAEE